MFFSFTMFMHVILPYTLQYICLLTYSVNKYEPPSWMGLISAVLLVLLSVSQLLWWNVCLLMNINKLGPHLGSLAHSIINPLILSLPFPRHLTTRLAVPTGFSLNLCLMGTQSTHTLTQIFSVRLWRQILCPLVMPLSIQTRPWKMFQSLCLLLLCFQRL